MASSRGPAACGAACAWMLAVVVTLWPALAGAQEPPSPPPARLPRGAVVVAASDAPIDATWSLALSVYRIASLRPRGLDDATARVLAGEAPGKQTSARHRELATLRASLKPGTVVTRRLLGVIASEVGVSGVVLVHGDGRQPRARLYLVKRRGFHDAVLSPHPDQSGPPSWDRAVSWLASLTRRPPRPTRETNDGSVLSSPWFWGALVAAAGVVAIGFASSRDDEPATIHLRGEVSRP